MTAINKEVAQTFNLSQAEQQLAVLAFALRAFSFLQNDPATQDAVRSIDASKATLLFVSHHVWYDILLATYQFVRALPNVPTQILVPVAGYMWQTEEKKGGQRYRQLSAIPGLKVMDVYRDGEELASPEKQRPKVRRALAGIPPSVMNAANSRYIKTGLRYLEIPGSCISLSPFGSTIQQERVPAGVMLLAQKGKANVIWAAAQRQFLPRPGFSVRLERHTEDLSTLDKAQFAALARETFSRLERD